MTPLLSWTLLLAIGALGAMFAVAVGRWYDDRAYREWEQDLDDWRAMCTALGLDDLAPPYDWDDQPHDVADEQPHRGE